MNLEQQVCSLDLAKRLKELGVKQESYFFWAEHPSRNAQVFSNELPIGAEYRTVSAFTVAELGEMLPKMTARHRVQIVRSFNHWSCEFHQSAEPRIHYEEADTEADARAEMLIYLIGNKLIAA